jgi:hypothetical protein
MKVLFGLPLRQTTGFVESLLELIGLDCSVPDFRTLCRRQKTLPVAIPYRSSQGGRYICSSPLVSANSNCRAVGGPKRRLWRKIHIGIDEQTLEIRAIEVTSSSIGDAPILPDLLNQILPDQEIGRPRNRQRHRRRRLRYSQMPRCDFCLQCEYCHPPKAPPVRS